MTFYWKIHFIPNSSVTKDTSFTFLNFFLLKLWFSNFPRIQPINSWFMCLIVWHLFLEVTQQFPIAKITKNSRGENKLLKESIQLFFQKLLLESKKCEKSKSIQEEDEEKARKVPIVQSLGFPILLTVVTVIIVTAAIILKTRKPTNMLRLKLRKASVQPLHQLSV